LVCPATASKVDFGTVIEGDLLVVEDDVLVHIKQQIIKILKFALPVVQASEAIAESDDCGHVVCADFLDCGFSPREHGVHIQKCHFGLVDKTVDGDDVLVARLSKESAELGVDVEGALTVDGAICAIQPVYGALVSAMVPAILTAWSAVEVKVDADAVFAGPLDRAEEVAPGLFGDVGVVVVSRYCPVREGYAYMVKSCGLHARKVCFGDEGCVVFFECCLGPACSQFTAQRPLVDDSIAGLEVGEEGRCNDWFYAEPASDIDSSDRHLAILPRLIESRHVIIGLC